MQEVAKLHNHHPAIHHYIWHFCTSAFLWFLLLC